MGIDHPSYTWSTWWAGARAGGPDGGIRPVADRRRSAPTRAGVTVAGSHPAPDRSGGPDGGGYRKALVHGWLACWPWKMYGALRAGRTGSANCAAWRRLSPGDEAGRRRGSMTFGHRLPCRSFRRSIWRSVPKSSVGLHCLALGRNPSVMTHSPGASRSPLPSDMVAPPRSIISEVRSNTPPSHFTTDTCAPRLMSAGGMGWLRPPSGCSGGPGHRDGRSWWAVNRRLGRPVCDQHAPRHLVDGSSPLSSVTLS